jgi:PAS domain S-box-containing protein
VRICDVRASPVLDWQGKPTNRVVVLRDVTERKRAEEALEKRVQQLAALGKASRAVTASLDLDQVLGEITALASEVVPSDYVSVALVDEGGHIEESAETLAGVPGIAYRVRENGLTDWIVQSHQPAVIEEIDDEGVMHPDSGGGRPREANPFIVQAGIKSLVGLPLIFGDRLMGVLYLHSRTTGAFRGRLPLLTAFANQASIAVRNVRAFQMERRRVSQLAVVNEVARKVVSILEPDQVLDETVQAIQRGFGYYNVGLLLMDRDAGEMSSQAIAGGFEELAPSGYRQAVGEGLIGWAAEHGRPLMVNDVSEDPRYIGGSYVDDVTRAELCVPLKLGDMVVGVLDVQETRRDAFDETDLTAMETLADMLAVAIENARLFSELEDELAERVLTEKELRDANVRLRTLIHAIPDMVYFKDARGCYLVANKAFEDFVGATGEQIVGRTDEELLPADLAEHCRRSDQGVLQGGDLVRIEEQATGEDGRTLFFDTIKVPLFSPDGDQMGLLGVSRDITERKQAEEEINRRTSQMEALREVALEITAQLDVEALLRSIVSRAVQLLDATAGGLYLYQPDRDVIEWTVSIGPDMAPPGSVLRRGEGLSGKVWETGEPLVVDNYDGWSGRTATYEGYRWSAVLGVPVRWGGEFLGVLDVLADPPRSFTPADAELLGLFAMQAAIALENARLYRDLRQQMGQLQETQGQLVQSAKLAAVGELSAGLAHELNNPLTSILGYAQLLLEEDIATGPVGEDLERIVAEAHRAREIVQNLSDFSRQTKARREPANVNELLQRTLAVVRYHLETSGVTIEESYCPTPPSLFLGAGQIRQVLLNLITNAFQAMPDGGTLGVRTSLGQDEIAISISDTGVGMSPQVRERVFEPFFTTDPSRKGLGLSVGLGVVQAHGGRITVESREGEGSTFTVWLPAATDGAEATEVLFAENGGPDSDS